MAFESTKGALGLKIKQMRKCYYHLGKKEWIMEDGTVLLDSNHRLALPDRSILSWVRERIIFQEVDFIYKGRSLFENTDNK